MNWDSVRLFERMVLDLGSFITRIGENEWSAMICPLCEKDLAMPTGHNSYRCEHPNAVAGTLEDFQ